MAEDKRKTVSFRVQKRVNDPVGFRVVKKPVPKKDTPRSR